MLTRDVTFEGWTVTDWSRFLSLFTPVRDEEESAAPSLGGLIVVHDGNRIRKLLHTQTGRLDRTGPAWPTPLDELADRYEASWAIAFHQSATAEVMERFGAGARRDDDILDQAVALTLIVRDLMREGAVLSWPPRLKGMPVPLVPVVRGALRTVCPDGGVMLLGIFDGGELWTSLALRMADGSIDRIVGPDEIRSRMGLLSGDWRRDYRHLVGVVERQLGPLAFGCFCEWSTLRALEVDVTPGAWARAVLVRDLIVSPLPAPLAVPLAVDAARATVAAARHIAQRFDPMGLLSPLLHKISPPSQPRDLDGTPNEGGEGEGGGDGEEPARPLSPGFQPLLVLRKLLSR